MRSQLQKALFFRLLDLAFKMKATEFSGTEYCHTEHSICLLNAQCIFIIVHAIGKHWSLWLEHHQRLQQRRS